MKTICSIAALVASLTFSARAAGDDPSAIVARFFQATSTGNVVQAESLFRCTNDGQRAHVHSYVTNAVATFASGKLQSAPMAAFVGTNAAVVAIEQKHSDFPGRREIEDGYLVNTPDGWRLLPNPEDFGVPINGLTLALGMEFNRLSHEFNDFRRAERKKDKDRNSEQPTPPYSEPAARPPQR